MCMLYVCLCVCVSVCVCVYVCVPLGTDITCVQQEQGSKNI